MADFTLKVTQGATLKPWSDPIGPNGEPSRLAPRGGRDQLFWLGKRNVAIVILAVVDLVEAPPDSALGGRLFAPYLAEGFGPPIIVSALGQSATIVWTPTNAGHHVIGVSRPLGGAVLLPFDIEA